MFHRNAILQEFGKHARRASLGDNQIDHSALARIERVEKFGQYRLASGNRQMRPVAMIEGVPRRADRGIHLVRAAHRCFDQKAFVRGVDDRFPLIGFLPFAAHIDGTRMY